MFSVRRETITGFQMFKVVIIFIDLFVCYSFSRIGFFKTREIGIRHLQSNCFDFNLKKILIVSKLSGADYEKSKLNCDKNEELKNELTDKLINYDDLLCNNNSNKSFVNHVVNNFKNFQCDVELVNRHSLTEEKVDWADIIVSVGGDGTFLLSASKIKDSLKPIIGFNSNPKRSEGYLCFPKHYSYNVNSAIEKIKNKSFKWLLRSRIRTTLNRTSKSLLPKNLHVTDYSSSISTPNEIDKFQQKGGIILPFLALNEVFIGEIFSAKVSHLEVFLNNSKKRTDMKSSGICICTGTGSTSWHLSINRVTLQTLADLLYILEVESAGDINELALTLKNIYNKKLAFKADDPRLCYSVRELISASVWPQPKSFAPRGFVAKIKVKSRCLNASLVLDGGVSYDFNDGDEAVFEIKPEDALRTICLT